MGASPCRCLQLAASCPLLCLEIRLGDLPLVPYKNAVHPRMPGKTLSASNRPLQLHHRDLITSDRDLL
jgi:hypothetical protein